MSDEPWRDDEEAQKLIDAIDEPERVEEEIRRDREELMQQLLDAEARAEEATAKLYEAQERNRRRIAEANRADTKAEDYRQALRRLIDSIPTVANPRAKDIGALRNARRVMEKYE